LPLKLSKTSLKPKLYYSIALSAKNTMRSSLTFGVPQQAALPPRSQRIKPLSRRPNRHERRRQPLNPRKNIHSGNLRIRNSALLHSFQVA
jgi:hypothetical protein